MFRRVLCALVVSAVIFPASYSFAATLGVTPPIRQPYPNVHLNIPLHSRIVPRFDHEVARIDGCAKVRKTVRSRAIHRDCRLRYREPRDRPLSSDVFGEEMR